MADLPYRYDDEIDGTLFVASGLIEMHKGNRGASMKAPIGTDAVELAEAALEVGKVTDHHVVADATLKAAEREVAENAARSMCERAAEWLTDHDFAWEAAQVRALPLLADDAQGEGEPCRSFTVDPHDPDVTVYCEHPDGDGHTGDHRAGLTWGAPAGDFRTRLVSEVLGEDRQDTADLLAEDPDATWEKAYACWSMFRAELERHRRGESPVLDRLAQLERDMGRMEKRDEALFGVDGRAADLARRVAALEELTRDQADLLEKHSRDLDGLRAPCPVCGLAPADQEQGPGGTCRHTPATRIR